MSSHDVTSKKSLRRALIGLLLIYCYIILLFFLDHSKFFSPVVWDLCARLYNVASSHSSPFDSDRLLAIIVTKIKIIITLILRILTGRKNEAWTQSYILFHINRRTNWQAVSTKILAVVCDFHNFKLIRAKLVPRKIIPRTGREHSEIIETLSAGFVTLYLNWTFS